jgi:xylan 1,4-beta-xylosidase
VSAVFIPIFDHHFSEAMMSRLYRQLGVFLIAVNIGFGQSSSVTSFMNPVIPGDHSDCTLTKIGNDFYTTGSSFNPTPVIYHSTDLVHWEAIAQPVAATWSTYGDAVQGGAWGGQIVYRNKKYWDFFSRSNAMYFVTADDPKGPWTMPTLMSTPAGVPGLGYDNSIFIDDDSTWYLLVKNGQVNNWIVQLGDNGQPKGAVYNLCWINPAPSYPFSWAEGPVMWKYHGLYYYSFARDVSGGQKVFRSPVLTGDQTSWTNLGDFFDGSDPLKSRALFQNPNHSSAAVMLDDSTSWVLHPLWRNAGSNEWYGQGRQGLLNQVRYDLSGKPTADYPINALKTAPKLPSSGIPWMVPHSDFFTSDKLHPEWSFLGYTPASSYSLTDRPGWLRLSDKRKLNTVIKTDAEHNYALMTRLDFDAKVPADQAGLWVMNGLQTLSVKLCSTVDSSGNKVIAFSYNGVTSTAADTVGTILWLKLVRENHVMTGYWSGDGSTWKQVGGKFDVTGMDNQQANYNGWCGNRQGLFVQNSTAYFDLYIYRDAYTPILAECPANQNGTTRLATGAGTAVLDDIHDNDWALYAGVEFGTAEYSKNPDSVKIVASPTTDGGSVEVWLDSLGTGNKIAECTINGASGYATFTAPVKPVSGRHDVYLKFVGAGTGSLFQLQSLCFTSKPGVATSVAKPAGSPMPQSYNLEQNYPNPFNPTTRISFSLPLKSYASLKIFDVMGREVSTLVSGEVAAGTHNCEWNGSACPSGTYFYRLHAGSYMETKRLTLLK